MSEICPCGSKLELRDCCISKNIAAIKTLFMNQLIMPERVEWAINYIEYKTIHNQHIIAEQNDYAESIGAKIACQRKCSTCCIEFIAARLEECDAIVIYLYSYPKLMNKFLRNYNDWLRHLTSEDNILKKTTDAYQKTYETRSSEDKKKFESLALEYARNYARCPFLEDDECLIYPIRPYICSTYTVISAKKYCDPKLSREEYIKHKRKIKSAINPLYFDDEYVEAKYFIDLKNRYIFGSMQKMVYEIIKYGPSFFCFQKSPDL